MPFPWNLIPGTFSRIATLSFGFKNWLLGCQQVTTEMSLCARESLVSNNITVLISQRCNTSERQLADSRNMQEITVFPTLASEI